ncbi:MAG: hypothetical protein ACK5PG_16740 [Lysobacterales bacterium]|jgi:hypothetical protein
MNPAPVLLPGNVAARVMAADMLAAQAQRVLTLWRSGELRNVRNPEESSEYIALRASLSTYATAVARCGGNRA